MKYDGEDFLNNNQDVLNNDEINQMINPILYTKGTLSDKFFLVLKGKIMVVCGQDDFQVEMTEFSCMGVDSLERDDYRPDFSAKVIGEATVLQIKREDYRKMISS